MDTEANNILKNTSSNLKLSILHETDHTKSWQTHEETGLLHHRWRMKRCKLLWESTLAISEEHENVRQIILSPLYTYIPTQIKKKTVYTDLFLNGIIQIAKNLETILILVNHKTDQIKQICHPTQ